MSKGFGHLSFGFHLTFGLWNLDFCKSSVTCDILVIGAGPAGSTAAKFAAKAGARVILLEKRKQVGVPVQCAEYVPWQITQEVKLPADVIAQRIDSMQTYMPDGEVVETSAKLCQVSGMSIST